jgi:hypothetical protein
VLKWSVSGASWLSSHPAAPCWLQMKRISLCLA